MRVPAGGPLPSAACRSTMALMSWPGIQPSSLLRNDRNSPRLSENACTATSASCRPAAGSGTCRSSTGALPLGVLTSASICVSPVPHSWMPTGNYHIRPGRAGSNDVVLITNWTGRRLGVRGNRRQGRRLRRRLACDQGRDRGLCAAGAALKGRVKREASTKVRRAVLLDRLNEFVELGGNDIGIDRVNVEGLGLRRRPLAPSRK
jgi:hypothetical protein